MPKFEVTIAQYGVPNEHGYVLSHADAIKLFNQLREQETMPLDEVGYYLADVRMDGDAKTGLIRGVCKFE